MKPLRPLIRLVLLLGVLLLAVALAGCAHVSKLVTARVEIAAGTNRVSVVQPKDTVIDKLTFDPGGGTLTLEGYASAANAGAIKAEEAKARAQAEVVAKAFGMVNLLAGVLLKAQGVPVDPASMAGTNATLAPPPAVFAVPPGMKLVPKDDPSTAKPEFE